jgi:hypothetical protein
MNLTYAPKVTSKCYIVENLNKHTFFVLGNGQVYSGGDYIDNDLDMNDNIEDLDSALALVLNLRSVYYKMNETEENDTVFYTDKNGIKHAMTGKTLLSDSSSKYMDPKVRDVLISERELRNIGMVAREVEKVVPELVRTRPDGTKSIAYFSVTALLLEAIKEQQAEIEKISRTVSDIIKALPASETSQLKLSQDVIDNEHVLSEGILFQNKPNPFSDKTIIRYQLKNPQKNATIFVFDMQGALKMTFDHLNKENGEIIIKGYDLQPGMYLYTLTVDGVEIDTKRMILGN